MSKILLWNPTERYSLNISIYETKINQQYSYVQNVTPDIQIYNYLFWYCDTRLLSGWEARGWRWWSDEPRGSSESRRRRRRPASRCFHRTRCELTALVSKRTSKPLYRFRERVLTEASMRWWRRRRQVPRSKKFVRRDALYIYSYSAMNKSLLLEPFICESDTF